jgi:hypothetical protein
VIVGRGPRRPALLGVAILVAVLAAGCARGSEDRPGAGAPAGTRASAPATFDELCRTTRTDCLRIGDRYVVRRRADASRAPAVLWEPGGPGLDATQMLAALPSWARTRDVLLLPEPWVYASSLACAGDPCATAPVRAREYVGLVEQVQRRWGPIATVYGFSFGALRAAQLLTANTLPRARFVVAAPAPPPGASGRAIGTARLLAARTAVARVLGCAGGSCDVPVLERLADLLAGRRGVTPRDAELALMGVGADARGNAPFLRRILATDEVPLTRGQILALRRAAFNFAQDGADEASRRAREAYLDGVCEQYSFEPPFDDAYLRIHLDCRERRFRPDVVDVRDASRVRLFVNTRDPVVPITWQLRWRALLPRVAVRRYAADAHVAPVLRTLDRALG